MLTEIYIEALLVDEDIADLVCKMWNADYIPDSLVFSAWLAISARD